MKMVGMSGKLGRVLCVLACQVASVMSSSLVTLWTAVPQAPLSIGFFRQEYWSGLPFPSPGDLPDPGIKPTSLTSSALVGGFFTTSATWEALGGALGQV